ncbi:MAG: RNA polymerase subunit sigma-70 [Sphingobacteriales bacterium UTBCD1]|nr:MAG: RNA polymerase subunit sigma-70 [Sphingobacteriales bacterium UTBCD1]
MSFMRNIKDDSRTDKDLILLYRQKGELSVLGELYQRYMELVYGVCLKYFKEPERAKDSVMMIFEELVTKLKKHEVENFKSWLYQLAKNHCLMQLRTPKNLKTVEINASFMQSEENVHLNGVLEKEDNLVKLEYCLGKLEEEQRKTIQLFYLEGKCYNEIADITGLDWNKVRSFIQNGRRNLKICMEKEKAGDQ